VSMAECPPHKITKIKMSTAKCLGVAMVAVIIDAILQLILSSKMHKCITSGGL
jgi:hypothetical protein